MTWVATAVVGSTAVGLYSANKAAGTQAAASDQSNQLQERMFNRQVELQEPFRQAGINALNKIESGNIMGEMDPSYSFRFQEGLKALDRSAAARSGLISGGALKAAQRYGQEFASNEFGNAYNRLAGRAGFGQTASSNMGTAAGNYGVNVGNNMMAGANARASGYVGGANALTSGLNQYLNYTQNKDMLGMLQGGGGGNASAAINPYFANTPGVGSITPT